MCWDRAKHADTFSDQFGGTPHSKSELPPRIDQHDWAVSVRKHDVLPANERTQGRLLDGWRGAPQTIATPANGQVRLRSVIEWSLDSAVLPADKTGCVGGFENSELITAKIEDSIGRCTPTDHDSPQCERQFRTRSDTEARDAIQG